jgi:hypothetical protein
MLPPHHLRCNIRRARVKIGDRGSSFTLPGFPLVQCIIDYALTETPTGTVGPIIGSTDGPGLVLGQGPTMAAKYRDEAKGYDAYIIRQWLEPKVVLDKVLDMICT